MSQAVWRPVLEARGVYTDATDRRVSLSRETFTEPWPDPPGLSLVPMMTAVLDTPDGRRQVTLQVNGTTDAMPATQTTAVTSAMWLAPGLTDGKLLDRETTVRLNGEVVEDAIELESAEGSDRDAG